MRAWKNIVVLLMAAVLAGTMAALSTPPSTLVTEARTPASVAGPSIQSAAGNASPPTIRIAYKVPVAAKRGLTNDPKPTITVVMDSLAPGVLFAEVGTARASERIEVAAASPKIRDVQLDLSPWQNLGPTEVVMRWESAAELPPVTSPALAFDVDTQGPIVDQINLVGLAGEPVRLVVRFQQTDLDMSLMTANQFRVRLIGASADEPIRSVAVLNNVTVQLSLDSLATGHYELTVVGTGQSALRDHAGNAAGGLGSAGRDQVWPFSSYPDRERGAHVEYPDFVARPKPDVRREFNPGDKVETRVARLYYYRDAHRVAQIVNRNVKSYNRAAVDVAQRTAEDARRRADEATDLRRRREREAVEKAKETRRVERELSELPAKLSDAARHESELADLYKREKAARAAREVKYKSVQAELGELNESLSTATQSRVNKSAEWTRRRSQGAAPEELSLLERQLESARVAEDDAKARRNAKSDQLTLLQAELADAGEDEKRAERELELARARRDQLLARQIELNELLPQLRQEEFQSREIMDQAQAAEDRSREEQFRREVAAAHEDPDTYVPGKIESIDPVTQVSISVIGEGVIQMRGPIRGINRIRTMIHQIDSPVGQVKVGIFTVQINGEHGDRMEKVAQRVEGHVDVSRFLTSQSLQLFRRAVQETASDVAESAEATYPSSHCQVDRDRKYLYCFFGRDFIDELYEMDSELLRSGNKILSIHAMDTVSLSNAMFLTALAKNDIRHRIMHRFMELVDHELPQAEYDFRKASSLLPCRLNSMREIQKNVWEKYRFRSVRGLFDADIAHPDTMTPMQREFIRLAQIFKAQLIAELELKQRVIERAVIEDPSNDEQREVNALEPAHRLAFEQRGEAYLKFVRDSFQLQQDTHKAANDLEAELEKLDWDCLELELKQLTDSAERDYHNLDLRKFQPGEKVPETFAGKPVTVIEMPNLTGRKRFQTVEPLDAIFEPRAKQLEQMRDRFDRAQLLSNAQQRRLKDGLQDLRDGIERQQPFVVTSEIVGITDNLNRAFQAANQVVVTSRRLIAVVRQVGANEKQVLQAKAELDQALTKFPHRKIENLATLLFEQSKNSVDGESALQATKSLVAKTRAPVQHRKILDHLIDEQEDKYIDLLEGTRAHIASIDGYLKRLAIAIEDDCKVQFYDPAFAGIRKSAYEYDVTLGQVERTTILTNNRALAKVSPQATMEFDLPKRDIMIVEAMKGAKALAEDYGALLQDPTFLAATEMLSGSPAVGSTGGMAGPAPAVKDVLPGLPSESDERILNQSGSQGRQPGAALQALIPDPAIYKFETGTGFQIRPVIQPDGDAIVYDFNYMYTTNVREPVRADEKHLGRVKRHFIDTQVQTSSFELREISRYQVALKASRTGRGVPLFEDIPGLGILFRPLASDESALQQNIILGHSTVYPTLFDLMGLRWAPHVVDTTHTSQRDAEHVIRGRRQTISDWASEEASSRVDEFLGISERPEYKDLHRPDLYHRQVRPSPYHPSGYRHECVADPTNQNFVRPDPRPFEMQHNPEYDAHGKPICKPGVPASEYPIMFDSDEGMEQTSAAGPDDSKWVRSRTSRDSTGNAQRPAANDPAPKVRQADHKVARPSRARDMSQERQAAPPAKDPDASPDSSRLRRLWNRFTPGD